jgi:four helix bundle protein
MQDFRNLQVWQKSHSITLKGYKLTGNFPKEEIFGLTAQLRRSLSSIPSNLAEGTGRGSDKDFARFVQIAMGSACESEYLIFLCGELGYFNSNDTILLMTDIEEIKKMLASLLKTLR